MKIKPSILLMSIGLLVLLSSCRLLRRDYYGEGIKSYKNGEFENAINDLSYFVVNFKNDNDYPSALFNLAQAYYYNNQNDTALSLFKEILYIKPKSSTSSEIKRYNSNTNSYQNQACIIIYNLYYYKKQYDSALKYLDLSSKVYRKKTYCTQQLEYDIDEEDSKYIDLFKKMGREDLLLEFYKRNGK